MNVEACLQDKLKKTTSSTLMLLVTHVCKDKYLCYPVTQLSVVSRSDSRSTLQLIDIPM